MDKIQEIASMAQKIVRYMHLPANFMVYRDAYVTIHVGDDKAESVQIWLNNFDNLKDTVVFQCLPDVSCSESIFRRGAWMLYLDKLYEKALAIQEEYQNATKEQISFNHSPVDDKDFFKNALIPHT